MTKPTRVRGFTCPVCVGVRLGVNGTKRPAAGLVVRYLVCSCCGYRLVTEERPSKTRKGRKGATS